MRLLYILMIALLFGCNNGKKSEPVPQSKSSNAKEDSDSEGKRIDGDACLRLASDEDDFDDDKKSDSKDSDDKGEDKDDDRPSVKDCDDSDDDDDDKKKGFTGDELPGKYNTDELYKPKERDKCDEEGLLFNYKDRECYKDRKLVKGDWCENNDTIEKAFGNIGKAVVEKIESSVSADGYKRETLECFVVGDEKHVRLRKEYTDEKDVPRLAIRNIPSVK